MQESFAANEDKLPPLDTHKLYLNLVFHDSILPPLRSDKSFANPKDDQTWANVPIAFSEAYERTNMDGCRVITYDGHLSTEVVDMMKSA